MSKTVSYSAFLILIGRYHIAISLNSNSPSRLEEKVHTIQKAKTYKAQETQGRITRFISPLTTIEKQTKNQNQTKTTINCPTICWGRLILPFSGVIDCSSLRGGTL